MDMLYRIIESPINEFYTSSNDKILIVAGARQVGKSFIIRHTLKKLFTNYCDYYKLSSQPGGLSCVKTPGFKPGEISSQAPAVPEGRLVKKRTSSFMDKE